MPFRLGVAAIISAGVTFGLLFLMQLLIASGKKAESEDSIGKILDFVRVKREEVIDTKKRKPKKPPTPEQPPPDMPKPKMDSMDSPGETINIAPVAMNADINISGEFGFSASDGEYLPIVKVAPIYPRRAQSRGLEGYVLVEFTVTKTGAVSNPVVVRAEPPNVFDRAALAAVLKFKYKPRVIDGEPIDVPGVQNMIRFELAD